MLAPGVLIVHLVDAWGDLSLQRSQVWTFSILASLGYAAALVPVANAGVKRYGNGSDADASRAQQTAMATVVAYLLTCFAIAVLGLILHYGFLVQFPRQMFLRLVYDRQALFRDVDTIDENPSPAPQAHDATTQP